MFRFLISCCLLLAPLAAQVRVETKEPDISKAAVAEIKARVERGVRRLKEHFPDAPKAPIRVVVHKRPATMPPQIRRRLHPGSPGLALLGKNEIHILLGAMQFSPPNDLGTVVDHELVHVLLDQEVGKAGPFVPVWLHEGLAQHLTETTFLGLKEDAIVFRVRSRTHHRLKELRDSFPRDDEQALRVAYAQSLSFVSFLVREVGLRKLLETARLCTSERPFPAAFVEVTGESLLTFEDRWADYLVHGSGAIPRFLRDNCFLYLIILAVPLLAIAVGRRLRRDRRIGEYLHEQEQDQGLE